MQIKKHKRLDSWGCDDAIYEVDGHLLNLFVGVISIVQSFKLILLLAVSIICVISIQTYKETHSKFE